MENDFERLRISGRKTTDRNKGRGSDDFSIRRAVIDIHAHAATSDGSKESTSRVLVDDYQITGFTMVLKRWAGAFPPGTHSPILI